jgi:hypothetical protein
MLILCNKTVALSDELAGISPKVMVKKRLETEIEVLRSARAEALDDIANSMRVELEIAGSVFNWSRWSSRTAAFVTGSSKMPRTSSLRLLAVDQC